MIELCVPDCNNNHDVCTIHPIPLDPLPRGHPNPPVYWDRDIEEEDDDWFIFPTCDGVIWQKKEA